MKLGKELTNYRSRCGDTNGLDKPDVYWECCHFQRAGQCYGFQDRLDFLQSPGSETEEAE